MNIRDFVILDFETGGRNPQSCEILQIAAMHLHPRRLVLGDIFQSYVMPLEPEKIEDDALRVNGIKREVLTTFPHPEGVWKDFTVWINKFNKKGSGGFMAPVMCGFNIRNFDYPILERYCKKYGPWKEGKGQQLFSSFTQVDLMDFVFAHFENSEFDLENYKLTNLCQHLGLSIEGAHNAIVDVKNTGRILIKFLTMYRNLHSKIKFKDAFKREEEE